MSGLTEELMNSAPWKNTEERAEWWRNKCYEVFEELEHYRYLEEQGRLIQRKQGEWYVLDGTHTWFQCSVCGKNQNIRWDYCPNCGAKMDEVEE